MLVSYCQTTVNGKLTYNAQVDESLSFSVFVLDRDLVAAFVGLPGVLEAVLCALGGGVDLVLGQTLAVVEPVGFGLGVGAVGNGHHDGLPGVGDVALVCGFNLRHSWRTRGDVSDKNHSHETKSRFRAPN